jgi:threonine synthase
MSKTRSTLTHLECGYCGNTYDANQLINLCGQCGKPLLARYDLDQARQTLTRESLTTREPSLWRYEEVLPVQNDWAVLKLGEAGPRCTTPGAWAMRSGVQIPISRMKASI